MKRFFAFITMACVLCSGAVVGLAEPVDRNIYDNHDNIIGYIDDNGNDVYFDDAYNNYDFDGDYDDGYESYYGYSVAYSADGWSISDEGYVVRAEFDKVAVKSSGKYKIVVPQSVAGHKVTGLADEWLDLEFDIMPNVVIYIPSTITFIAENALHNGPVCMPEDHPMYVFESGSYAEKYFKEYNATIVTSEINGFRTMVGTVDSVDVGSSDVKKEETPKTNDNVNTNTAVGGLANEGVSIILNGSNLNFSQAPIIENGTTFVPMRSIFEALGATVEWDGETKTVTAVKGDTVISLTLYSSVATINGEETELSAPAKLVDGTTMVPLRFVSESLGADVGWDGETKTVTITG